MVSASLRSIIKYILERGNSFRGPCFMLLGHMRNIASCLRCLQVRSLERQTSQNYSWKGDERPPEPPEPPDSRAPRRILFFLMKYRRTDKSRTVQVSKRESRNVAERSRKIVAAMPQRGQFRAGKSRTVMC